MALYQTNPKPGKLGKMDNLRSRGQPSAFHGPRLRPAKSDRQPLVGHRHLVLRNKAKLGYSGKDRESPVSNLSFRCSQPPDGNRIGILAERNEILRQANDTGLTNLHLELAERLEERRPVRPR